ncbi:DUF6100 family protein [Acutalibacter sp. JLR.KK004]|uniref:DUF6100 family protein n=1 Tax=Acutalibacter sp. JLR.KK004 TaxID=3112622 RepID=UPI002FF249B9
MSVFLEVLDKIDRKLKRMTEQVEMARWLWNAGHFEAAFEHAFQLEDTAERATLLTRVLPAYTGRPSARDDIRRILAKRIPVEIGFTEQGWFGLRIPALLPRKKHGSVDYIRDFLYPAMQDFFRDKEPVQYTDCVLIFRHVYSRSRPERQHRDHDNIEANIVTDIVALYTMPDDSPAICDHHYCTAASEDDRTEIYVVPREDFPYWLEVEKSMPDEGVGLYDNLPKHT